MTSNFKNTSVSNVSVNWLLDTLQRSGLDLEEVSRQFDLRFLISKNNEVVITMKQYHQFLTHCAEVKSDNTYGLTIAKHINLPGFGLTGYMLSNASDVAEAINTLKVYSKLMDNNNINFHLHISNKMAIFEYKAPYPDTSGYRIDVDLTFAAMVLFIRSHLGENDNWYPYGCRFTYPQPKFTDDHAVFFGDNISFDQHANQLIFPESILRIKKSDSDSTLYKLLKVQANKELEQQDSEQSIVQYLEKLITDRLGVEQVTREVAATLLNKSHRSLNRHLQIEGTSFKEIKNRVLINAAKKELIDGKMQISELALWLGYSESSAFTRHFKKVTGTSPKQFQMNVLKR